MSGYKTWLGSKQYMSGYKTWLGSKQYILGLQVSDHCALILKTHVMDWGSKPFKFLDI